MKQFKELRKLLNKRAKYVIDWLTTEMTGIVLSNTLDESSIRYILPDGLKVRQYGRDSLIIYREDNRAFTLDQLEAMGF